MTVKPDVRVTCRKGPELELNPEHCIEAPPLNVFQASNLALWHFYGDSNGLNVKKKYQSPFLQIFQFFLADGGAYVSMTVQ